ncbi:MAG: hypothetical protein NTX61_18985 [Bacteroidetes bacterium]|nr:hypothetical protein [Bacteroidota bacterium]
MKIREKSFRMELQHKATPKKARQGKFIKSILAVFFMISLITLLSSCFPGGPGHARHGGPHGPVEHHGHGQHHP